MISRSTVLVLLMIPLMACEGAKGVTPTADSDAGTQPATDGGESGPEPMTSAPVNRSAPTIRIVTPADGTELGADEVRIEGEASDDSGLATVFVRVGPNVPVLADSSDSFRTWSVVLPVPLGSFVVEAVAVDAGGLRSEPALVRLSRPAPADGAPPTVTIVRPEAGSSPRTSTVLIEGTASDDVGVVRMQVERDGELLTSRAVETDNFFATWARTVVLIPGRTNRFVFRAFDTFGRFEEARIDLVGQPEIDRAPPQISVTNPRGPTVDAASVRVMGSASDRLGVREVKIRIGVDEGGSLRFGPSHLAESTNGFATFSADVSVPSGPFTLEVKAIDVSGLAASQRISIENLFVSEWSEERRVPLFLRGDQRADRLRLELDREGVNQVISPSIQRSLELLDLDPGPTLSNILDEIKSACGTAWQRDDPNPRHDCSLTPLGRTFRGSNGSWQTSPEYSLVRILTLTPANIVVDGTSAEGVRFLANALNLGGGFSQIIADLFGIPRTQEIVTTGGLAESLRTGLLAPHPNTRANGDIPITLFDAVNDLSSLGAKLGPQGGHPGVLDPAVTPRGVVFTPSFKMTIIAESNLRWLDGIDLDQGKEYISVVVDTTGPTFDDVLEFDFVDPSRFSIDGLVPNATADLRVRFDENPGFVPACVNTAACRNNLPGSPVAPYIWTTPTWEVEHVTAQGAYNLYQQRRTRFCPGACFLSRVEVGQNGDPAAWTKFSVLFNLGNPPDDQYLWDIVIEVAQVALHNLPTTTLAEGTANVAFNLVGIPLGLTPDGIRTAVRPVLQAQASELSDRLLGDYARNNGSVDFFYRRGLNGAPYIFFAAPEDPRPAGTYEYDRPGFYADPERQVLLSSLSIPGSGDDTHQKLQVGVGETVTYVEDEQGRTFRVRFVAEAGEDDIVAWVARRNR